MATISVILGFMLLICIPSSREIPDDQEQDGNFLLGQGYDDLKNEVSLLQGQVSRALNSVNKLENLVQEKKLSAKDASTGSSVYTRWGRSSCPSDSVNLYSGYMASSLNTDDGSAFDFLCLTTAPQFANRTNGTEPARGNVYGTEYQGGVDAIFDPSHLNGTSFADQDVPCAACHVENRSSVLMVPARKTCPEGWTLEYWGYLMAAVKFASGSHPFVCVDYQPETIPGGEDPEPAGYIYNVHARCGAITCPNYVDGWELTCAVCSR